MSAGDHALADAVRGWDPAPVGSSETLSPGPSEAFAALLDQEPPSEVLPPLWHWFHFLDRPRSDELGGDGHPTDGHFLPPIPRRRRMFAGGRLEVERPLAFGSHVRRTSRITDVTPKTGRSGEMLFVTERREYADGHGVAVVEEQDIVYRQAPDDEGRDGIPPRGGRVPATEPLSVPVGEVGVVAAPTLLFRFSALTYNAHRIHYDESYAVDVEGYPGLVVHGPLLALLLLEPTRRAGRSDEVVGFTFRLRRPAFAGTPVVVTTEPELAAGPVGGEPSVTGEIHRR